MLTVSIGVLITAFIIGQDKNLFGAIITSALLWFFGWVAFVNIEKLGWFS